MLSVILTGQQDTCAMVPIFDSHRALTLSTLVARSILNIAFCHSDTVQALWFAKRIECVFMCVCVCVFLPVQYDPPIFFRRFWGIDYKPRAFSFHLLVKRFFGTLYFPDRPSRNPCLRRQIQCFWFSWAFFSFFVFFSFRYSLLWFLK